MKLPLLALAAVTLSTGVRDLCQPGDARAAAARFPAVPAHSVTAIDTVMLHIEGMDCGGCIIATRKVLERLDGVTKAEVSYEHKRAVVTFDPNKVTTQQMIDAVATLKYTATVVPAGATPAARPSGKA